MDPEDRGTPSFDLVAIIDPVSKGAQKITSTLMTLSKVVNAKIRIFLNCVDKHSELPQKSYFRVVLEPELTFSTTGELSAGTVLYKGHLNSIQVGSKGMRLTAWKREERNSTKTDKGT